ncbi:UNVERIFIED_CONTAM: elongation factor Tu GTP binding domain-containing protein [Hammondia hammondi]|eukprot:XP_008888198.1 elongation factor Tu GTP binding domain-containing protein [Hammondia hammondi]
MGDTAVAAYTLSLTGGSFSPDAALEKSNTLSLFLPSSSRPSSTSSRSSSRSPPSSAFSPRSSLCVSAVPDCFSLSSGTPASSLCDCFEEAKEQETNSRKSKKLCHCRKPDAKLRLSSLRPPPPRSPTFFSSSSSPSFPRSCSSASPSSSSVCRRVKEDLNVKSLFQENASSQPRPRHRRMARSFLLARRLVRSGGTLCRAFSASRLTRSLRFPRRPFSRCRSVSSAPSGMCSLSVSLSSGYFAKTMASPFPRSSPSSDWSPVSSHFASSPTSSSSASSPRSPPGAFSGVPSLSSLSWFSENSTIQSEKCSKRMRSSSLSKKSVSSPLKSPPPSLSTRPISRVAFVPRSSSALFSPVCASSRSSSSLSASLFSPRSSRSVSSPRLSILLLLCLGVLCVSVASLPLCVSRAPSSRASPLASFFSPCFLSSPLLPSLSASLSPLSPLSPSLSASLATSRRASPLSASLSLPRGRSRKFLAWAPAATGEVLRPQWSGREARASVSSTRRAALFSSASSPSACPRAEAERRRRSGELELRNVAIIAHVDHGKTTLVDALLVHAAELQSASDLRTSWDLEKRKNMQRMMDTGQLEKERGITITAKVCSLRFKDGRKINIIDTPGHADFSGEVERVMHLADGVLLVVDAVEGCKPQTRVVLQKALQAGLHAVVVVNKVDRNSARPEDVAAQVFDLFLQLDASEEQAEFEVVYASALNRQSGVSPSSLVSSMDPLVNAIMRLPSPRDRREAHLASLSASPSSSAGLGGSTPGGVLQMQIAHVDRNAYRGVMAMGKLLGGTLIPGMRVGLQRPGEPLRKATFTGVFEYDGMDLRELSITANAGSPTESNCLSASSLSPSSSLSPPSLSSSSLSSSSPASPSSSLLAGGSSSSLPGGPATEGGAEQGSGEEEKASVSGSENAAVVRSPSSLPGDILVLAGVSTDVRVGDSVVDLVDPRPLAPLKVADPSVSIQVLVNTSPLAGKEVDTPTSGTMLRQRLLAMAERDVSLRVDTNPDEDGMQSAGGSSCLLRLSGRGPLHLALVLETLRREGFELLVAAPSVLPRWGDDGELLEPVEEMEVAVPQEHIGTIINEVKQRKGDLLEVTNAASSSASALSTLIFRLPTRKAFGLRSSILTASKGTASIHAAAGGYQTVPKGEETDGLVKIARKDRHAIMGSSAEFAKKKEKSGSASKGCNAFIPKEGAKQSGGFNIKRGIEGAGGGKKKDRGFLVATEEGTVTGKGALSAQERGQLFVAPGDQVYGGMIVGLNSRGGDLPINVCKAKKLTNMRAAHKEISEGIVPPIEVTLDYGMEIIGANEVMEVTPRSIRLAVRSAMRR